MSCTIRRKGHVPEWVTREYKRVGNIWKYVVLEGDERKIAIAKYHSDTAVGYGWSGNAPKSFRKSIDRIKRAKETAEVRRVLKQGDYEDYSFKPRKRDAGWLFW